MMWSTFLTGGVMDPNRESGLGSESDNMAELAALLQTEIPEGRSSLADSHTNLERVAEYCEGNYFQSENKRHALEETKNYTTQSLASVAYQINTLAFNFLQLLDLQTAQLAEMESQMNHIAQTVMIHKEKVARREIGVLTANKTTSRQYKIVAPANPEKPIKYVRKGIDYTALDDVGHGVRTGSTGGTPRSKQRGSSQGSIQSVGSSTPVAAAAAAMMGANLVGPAPTTKPPTPPQAVRQGGSLSKGSREYRTPPAVAPPQVPSHYAPNYPLGHPRRGERGAGYSTLPMPPASHLHTQTLPHPHHHPSPPMSPPQVGMVHPIPHSNPSLQAAHPQTPPPPPPPVSYAVDHHSSMPPPPGDAMEHPSGVMHHLASGAGGGHHSHTLPHHPHSHAHPHPQHPHPQQQQHHLQQQQHLQQLQHVHVQLQQQQQQQHRPGNVSPPLPPPPPPEDEHPSFGRPRTSHMMPIVPDEEDLPGWVPKNYIEKVVAIYDYYADKEDELSFQESSVIYVLKKNDDGWWEGVMDGITGLFPGNYVEPCV